jgi:hypothetical protein
MEDTKKIVKLETMMEQNVREHREIKEMLVKFNDKLDEALELKADRWVQVAMTWLIYSIIGGLMTAFIRFLIFWDGKI